MRRQQSEVYSIFGQIEAVVAEAMISEDKANRIELENIPVTVLMNDKGETAKFAVCVRGVYVQEFNERVARLRA
jgi:hypothetical protein